MSLLLNFVALGYVALILYAIVANIMHGDAAISSISDFLFLIPAVIIVIYYLNKLGRIRNPADMKMANRPELKIVMNHISANNTKRVSIDKDNICIYNINVADNCHFNFSEHGIKSPDKKAMQQIASYIGKFGFNGRYYISEKYDESFIPGSGRITGGRITENGSFVTNVDYGDTMKTFKGLEVYNKKLKGQ